MEIPNISQVLKLLVGPYYMSDVKYLSLLVAWLVDANLVFIFRTTLWKRTNDLRKITLRHYFQDGIFTFKKSIIFDFKVITMEMDLKQAKSEIQRLQSEREKFEQVLDNLIVFWLLIIAVKMPIEFLGLLGSCWDERCHCLRNKKHEIRAERLQN